MIRFILLSRITLGALLVCMLSVSFLAHAQNDYGHFTALQIASLPQYCQDKLNGNRNQQKWSSYFGVDNWSHFHHFCNGLIYFSQASIEIDESVQPGLINGGIGEFNYVLARWPKSFPYYQQAQMYKSQLEMMRN